MTNMLGKGHRFWVLDNRPFSLFQMPSTKLNHLWSAIKKSLLYKRIIGKCQRDVYLYIVHKQSCLLTVVGPKNKIGHPAGCRFPCWVPAECKSPCDNRGIYVWSEKVLASLWMLCWVSNQQQLEPAFADLTYSDETRDANYWPFRGLAHQYVLPATHAYSTFCFQTSHKYVSPATHASSITCFQISTQ